MNDDFSDAIGKILSGFYYTIGAAAALWWIFGALVPTVKRAFNFGYNLL